ncbi:uncharacterized protein JN550_009417 [Neoarthrinium moseri]|uniref:uncharacterized protein n=1 Tax=Neoarthrinium moseri TaxID=1658444 RepID=UPI001FDAD8E6|nr:uncharacterized protein JN550_009417 [Neoarthrinium moseri]KAI1863717.1 hypothetical protein JN550_009417 [Neoarthrinium moseri]
MVLGPGAPPAGGGSTDRATELQMRFKNVAYIHPGSDGVPEVQWLCRPPAHKLQRAAAVELVRKVAKRCRCNIIWIMGGLHSQATTGWVKTATGHVREMADDDCHITVRMGTAENICKLHGHIYIHKEKEWIMTSGGERKLDIARRLMTESERTYVGGLPYHLWIWGPYAPVSATWPRIGPKLPEPPFVRKPEYSHLDEKRRGRTTS